MAKRPCLDCGTPAEGTRCEQHRLAKQRTRERGRNRPTKQQRGYTKEYDSAREVALATATRCRTCGGPFTPDNPATGGHMKAVRRGGTAYDGVKAECQDCNYGWRRSGS
jgi:hypothetical protein